MKLLPYALICFLLIVVAMPARSQTLSRQPGETAEAFVKRAFTIEELPHPVIETGEWDSTKKVIIFFKNEDVDNVTGYLLTPVAENKYSTTLIDTFYQQAAQLLPTIETVFFANADKDSAREIVIITKAQSHSPRYWDEQFYGYYYNTFVYDNPATVKPVKRLLYFKSISEHLSGDEEGKTFDKKTGKVIKKETAKYKTVASIRQALKDMGYSPVAAKH